MTDYALILTHDRPDMLAETVDAVGPQVDLVVIVDNASNPPVRQTWQSANYMLMRDPTQPPNLAHLWNDHLDLIAGAERVSGSTSWNVAMLCDDATPPAGWFAVVSAAMRAQGAAAASSHSYTAAASPYLLTALTNDANRMCPWAFVVAGEKQVRADTTMAWHYFDTDFDWQCRQQGGVLITTAPIVRNRIVGGWTDNDPAMIEQVRKDEQTFTAKWQTR